MKQKIQKSKEEKLKVDKECKDLKNKLSEAKMTIESKLKESADLKREMELLEENNKSITTINKMLEIKEVEKADQQKNNPKTSRKKKQSEMESEEKGMTGEKISPKVLKYDVDIKRSAHMVIHANIYMIKKRRKN